MSKTEKLRIEIQAVDQFSETFKKADSGLKGMARGFKAVGAAGKIMTGLGIALGGAIGVATTQAIGFEESMSKVAAVSGATGLEFDLLSDKARELGKKTSFSASEASDGLYYMALAGWNTEQMLSGLEPVLHLAEAGALDLGRASDLVTDSMATLGVQVGDLDGYLDKIARTASRSNTDIDELMAAFTVAGSTFRRFNVPLEEANAFLGILANRGTKGSEAGTALNAIMDRLTSGTGQAATALEELGISAFDADGNFIGMEETFLLVKDTLEGLTEEQREHYLSMIAGLNHGKSFQKILDGLNEEYSDLKKEIENSDGALKEMRDTMKDNMAGVIENLISSLQEMGIALGTSLLPELKNVAGGAQNLLDWFNDLSSETQGTVAKFAVLTSGAAVLAGGLAIFVSLLPAITAGFTLLAGPIGVVIGLLGVTAVGAVGAFVKATEEAVPQVELFTDEVSENTQKVVGHYMDMSEKADIALKEMAWSQETVTKESAETMIEQQKHLSDELMAAIDKKHEAEMERTVSHLDSLENLDEETKADILAATDEYYDKERDILEKQNERIQKIIERAAEEERSLTKHEAKEILAIREQMKEQAIEMMSENEIEQKIILEKMKDNSETISAREAAEVVKNAKKKKDEVVAEAEKQFDDVYAWTIRQRDELGTLTDEQAKEIIDNAREQRDEVIDNAEETYDETIRIAKQQSGDHVDLIDWTTGDIKTKWQVFKEDKLGIFKDIARGINDHGMSMANSIRNNAQGAKNRALQHWEALKTNSIKLFEDVKKGAKSRFNNAKDSIINAGSSAKDGIKKHLDKISGFFSNMKLSFPKIKPPKLPRFSLKGNFSLMPPSVPKVSIKWNALGGLFTKPTVFNTPMGLQGFGEAGPEAAIPLTPRVLGMIGEKIVQHMPEPELDYETPGDYSATVARELGKSSAEDSSLLREILDELKAQRRKIIEMDSREVGHLVEPHVSERQERDEILQRRFAQRG